MMDGFDVNDGIDYDLFINTYIHHYSYIRLYNNTPHNYHYTLFHRNPLPL